MALELKQPAHRELSGGDLLAQCLRQLGVEVAFGVHGGHLDAFLVGCAENNIRLVDTRHEEVAIQAAQGYAKVSHKAGVAFVTANSGYGNSLPGIATAFADRSPVVVVTSSPPLRDAEINCLQGSLDQVVVATPMTKFAHRIVQAEEIPRLVAHAHRVACTGAPGKFLFLFSMSFSPRFPLTTAFKTGPVLLDVPIDVLFRPVQQDQISWGSITAPLPYPPRPHSDAIAEAIQYWKSAKQPAIIIGTGCKSTEVRFREFRIKKN